MANIKSAIKRVQTNSKKHALNTSFKSDMRSNIKQVEKFIEENDVENAKKALQKTTKKIDKAVQKGLIHKNNGNRHKSRLANKITKLGA